MNGFRNDHVSYDTVTIRGHRVGAGRPRYVIAEIDINDNSYLDLAKKPINVAVATFDHRSAFEGCKELLAR